MNRGRWRGRVSHFAFWSQSSDYTLTLIGFGLYFNSWESDPGPRRREVKKAARRFPEGPRNGDERRRAEDVPPPSPRAPAPPSSPSALNPRPVITRTSQALRALTDEATFHNRVAARQTPALLLQATCGSIITGGEEVGLRGTL